MMDFLNWVSDHPFLVITILLIVCATYSIPRIVAGFLTAMTMDRMGR